MSHLRDLRWRVHRQAFERLSTRLTGGARLSPTPRCKEPPVSADVTTYLNFRGNAREAMTFYRSVLGGTLNLSTFKDFGMPVGEGEEDLVMHSQIDGDAGPILMGSDVPSHMGYTTGENTFSVSLSGDDEETLTRWFTALGEGGTVSQPLEKAPWGDSFGMLQDRFGVSWLVNISGAASA
jgi:PhnB protein